MQTNRRYTGGKTGLQRLKSYILQGWLLKWIKLKKSIMNYWLIMHELAVINGIAMKGKKITIQFLFQILKQLHSKPTII